MERQGVQLPEMDVFVHPSVTEEDSSMSALFDWSEMLDFAMDDRDFNSLLQSEPDQVQSISQPEPPVPEPSQQLQEERTGTEVVNSDRIRKRDPRLTCSNFLAGIIPCACPEVDAALAEEDKILPGKKRVRTARVGLGQVRCQVPGCEVDISELKGYHKRHRVCLKCATAPAVLLDGETKRYCQQCGKFHILSDFDEGKRSCRRKLERHNTIRRRKATKSKGAVDKELPGTSQSEDGGTGKDSLLCSSSQMADQEVFLESEDGHGSTLHSAPNSQNVNSDSGVSFVASDETNMDGGKDESKVSRSPSYCDNKSAYSSMCPTDRISFKLYQWNPADFPRSLRHQIFQWLANMPVELEGYIRPGCTILTVFIAMPKIMWVKLYEDPIAYLHDFIITPGRMLSGRGTIIVHLNNTIFHVKDGTSVMKANVEVQAPRLHYVHPTCFEAGKPMEFVACGSNLLQPKSRFLISFAGKYLPYDYCVASSHGQSEGDSLSFDHQLYKIYVPHTEPNLIGPAFIEVENESGLLSNFIPVLIGDKEICCEMKIIQHRLESSRFPERSQFMASGSLTDLCEVSVLRKTALAEFVLDIAWLLKVPASESLQQIMSSSQVKRFNSLFSFLIYNESTTILEKMLENLKILMDKMGLNKAVNGTIDTDMVLLLRNMDHASEILHQKLQKNANLIQHSADGVSQCSTSGSQSCSGSNLLVPIANQDLETRPDGKLGVTVCSTAVDGSEIVPLLNKEVIMDVSLIKEWPGKSRGHIFSGTGWSSRPTIFVVAVAVVCFGMCVVVLHPAKVGNFAVSIHRSLFGKY